MRESGVGEVVDRVESEKVLMRSGRTMLALEIDSSLGEERCRISTFQTSLMVVVIHYEPALVLLARRGDDEEESRESRTGSEGGVDDVVGANGWCKEPPHDDEEQDTSKIAARHTIRQAPIQSSIRSAQKGGVANPVSNSGGASGELNLSLFHSRRIERDLFSGPTDRQGPFPSASHQ